MAAEYGSGNNGIVAGSSGGGNGHEVEDAEEPRQKKVLYALFPIHFSLFYGALLFRTRAVYGPKKF